MPLVATNTNPVPFHISMSWSLAVFTGMNLQVFQSDPSCFQKPLEEILSLLDFRKYFFSVGHWLLKTVTCGFGKSIRKQRFYTSLNVVVHYFLQSICFRSKIRKNVYPCIPQFCYLKVGCKGYTLHGHVCMM